LPTTSDKVLAHLVLICSGAIGIALAISSSDGLVDGEDVGEIVTVVWVWLKVEI